MGGCHELGVSQMNSKIERGVKDGGWMRVSYSPRVCELGWSIGEWELACVTKAWVGLRRWDGIYLGCGLAVGRVGVSRGEREHISIQCFRIY